MQELKIKKKLGDKIFELRQHSNMSQIELGTKLGVSRQTVSQWEANISQPSLKNLQILCDIFNAKIDELLPDKNEQDKDKVISSDRFNQAECGGCDLADISVCDGEKQEIAAVVALDKNTAQSPSSDNVCEHISKTKRKIDTSVIVVLTLCVMALLLGLFILICCFISYIPNISSNGDSVTTVSFNFSIENIGWILVCMPSAFLVIFGILYYCMNIKRISKNGNKKER